MRQRMSLLSVVLFCTLTSQCGSSQSQSTADDGAVVSASEKLVDFSRDIAPLFSARCVHCHGPQNAKNDFRIDDREATLGYVEPGNLADSLLWTDYLRAEDVDLLMPPTTHKGPLSNAELALVRVWIEEGASWPQDAVVPINIAGEETIIKPAVAPPLTLVDRVWTFQGYFHPATVHFPIALLLVGALFVVIGWRFPVLGEHVSLACLFLGTASAVVACMMGWSLSTQEGYGSWDRVDTNSEIFWHRWSAVIVTLSAIITSLFAIAWLRSRSDGIGKVWRVGLLVVAAMVGAVGHQGGELTHGAAFFQEAFDILLGTPSPTSPVGTEESPAPESPAPESPIQAKRSVDQPVVVQ